MRAISVTAAAVVTLVSSLPTFALQRVFVSSTGSDSNACIPTAPCRSFAHAMTVVDPGGEILALDSAGYGAVTVTKSVSILGNPGFYAGIAAGSGTAVTISTASVNVILRGLNINGIGATTGISMTAGSSLTLENCVISNFGADGIDIVPSSGTVSFRMVNTLVRGNGGTGVYLNPTSTGIVTGDVTDSKILGNGYVGLWSNPATGTTVDVSVNNTVSSGNQWGFVVIGTGTGQMVITNSVASNNGTSGFQTEQSGKMTVSGSMATGNSVYGFNVIAGTLETQGNNTVRGNATNVNGSLTAVSGG